ncbi:hypothetical protein NLU13_8955 [Sarocladium strictum]|uniref:DUF7730 domain-containing protein n=1 Tax=Sarocladium strictum TaxID=5046 RepID=A0AA39G9U5_SARSR|nr:hypothetical protein NLU13_8955 [Sarocladium strictum]
MTVPRTSSDDSPFLRLPAELRLMVYNHLLSSRSDDRISVKTRERYWKKQEERGNGETSRRTNYYALDRRSLGRCSYKTTYGLDGGQGEDATTMHPAIMAVNRKIYGETAYLLYASHEFHFGHHLDAIGPFIGDLTPSSRDLIHSLSLTCFLHSPSCCAASDWRFWSSMSHRLGKLPKLRRLRITMQGGRPTGDWDGPKSLSVSDIRLLYATHHECLDWARELAAVDSLEDVEIEADIRPIPKPETTATLIYAALSASIEGSLIDFLRDELNVPARLKERKSSEEVDDEEEADKDAGPGSGPEPEPNPQSSGEPAVESVQNE